MKKIILMVAAIVMAASASAQLSFGVKGGVNVANISNSDGDSFTGYYVGAVADYALSKDFSFQPELLFSFQGTKWSASALGISASAKEKLSYINIPLLAKYKVIDGLSVELGPQLGFNVGSKTDYDSSVGTSGSVDVDANTFDFGFDVGASYIFAGGLGVQVRYNLGLTDVYDHKGDKTYANRVFQAGLVYMF